MINLILWFNKWFESKLKLLNKLNEKLLKTNEKLKKNLWKKHGKLWKTLKIYEKPMKNCETKINYETKIN